MLPISVRINAPTTVPHTRPSSPFDACAALGSLRPVWMETCWEESKKLAFQGVTAAEEAELAEGEAAEDESDKPNKKRTKLKKRGPKTSAKGAKGKG